MSIIDDCPPPIELLNTINLVAAKDSTILGVTLYPTRAEVSRLFTFNAKVGHNNICIAGLPSALDSFSSRVNAGSPGIVVNDFAVHSSSHWGPPKLSDEQRARKQRKAKLRGEVASHRTALGVLDGNLTALGERPVEMDTIVEATDTFIDMSNKLQDKILDLEEQIALLSTEISSNELKTDHMLRTEFHVSAFVAHTSEVALQVKYLVNSAFWTPKYDLYLKSDTKEDFITMVYEVIISHTTGEDWENVPLTLATVSQTYANSPSPLFVWPVSLREGQPGNADDDSQYHHFSSAAVNTTYPAANVPWQFTLPDSLTIKTDGNPHHVTVEVFHPSAEMEWILVPKSHNWVHVSATLKNSSNFVLPAGSATVFLDGALFSSSLVPATNLEETFTVALGYDPSITTKYPPRVKESTRSGLFKRTMRNTYTQLITVTNTKSWPVSRLTVIDQFPVSFNPQIGITILNPDLPIIQADVNKKKNAPVVVQPGVTAQWGSWDGDVGVVAAMKDGFVKWTCEDIPEKGVVNLALKWKVSWPARLVGTIVGLE